MSIEDRLDEMIDQIGPHRVLEWLANVMERREDLDSQWSEWAAEVRALGTKIRLAK